MPPANDNFASRTVLGAVPIAQAGDNTDGTLEAGEPDNDDAQRSVWYEFTPAVTGTYQIDTEGSSFDTKLGVYTGSSVNALSIVDEDDDSGVGATSLINTVLTSGVAYKIAVTGYDVDEFGAFILNINFIPPPDNDNFADATLLVGSSISEDSSNAAATREGAELDLGYSNVHSVWYEWLAPASGTIAVDTIGSALDTVLAIFTGSVLASLTLLKKDHKQGAISGPVKSRIVLAVTEGVSYKILVDGNAGAVGDFTLNINYITPPANDDFANSTFVSGAVVSENGDTTDASIEDDEPIVSDCTRSIWYAWRPPASGVVTVGITGGDVVRVYTGDSLDDLTLWHGPPLGISSTPSIKFWANVNTVYYFKCGYSIGGFGSLVFSLTLVPSSLTLDRHFITSQSSQNSRKAFVVDSAGNYYVVSSSGIYKSTDGGVTWANLGFVDITGLGTPSASQPSAVIDSDDNVHIIFACTLSNQITNYYAKFSTASSTWSNLTALSLITFSVTAVASTAIVIDSSDNIYLIYKRQTGGIDDVYYRKLTGAITLEAEVRLTVTGGISNILAVCTPADDIYIAYKYTQSGVGEKIRALYVNKNFSEVITVHSISTTLDSDLLNATRLWINMMVDANGVVRSLYRIAYRDDQNNLKTEILYSESETFVGEHISDAFDAAFATISLELFVAIQTNLTGQTFLLFGTYDGTNTTLKYIVKTTGSWSSITALYTIQGARGVRTTRNYIDSGISFIEESSMYYVETGLLIEGEQMQLCPYVTGGEIRKMVDNVTGLDHFDGETVKAVMDGDIPRNEAGKEVDNAFVVTGGTLVPALPKKAAVVHVGLGYEGIIKMLKTSQGSPFGTGQTKMQHVFLTTLRLYRTLGLSIGYDEDHLKPIFNDSQRELFTGDKKKLPAPKWDKQIEMEIRQTKPLPANILAAIFKSEVEEGQ